MTMLYCASNNKTYTQEECMVRVRYNMFEKLVYHKLHAFDRIYEIWHLLNRLLDHGKLNDTIKFEREIQRTLYGKHTKRRKCLCL